jgi:isoleucyl-tRNA synthetase
VVNTDAISGSRPMNKMSWMGSNYTIVNMLRALLASITTFTCNEAMADRLNDCDFEKSSFQLTDWPNSSIMADFSNEKREFDSLLSLRTKVNERVLEARQNKLIGQSLYAKVILEISSEDKIFPLLQKDPAILPEIFITWGFS